MGHSVHNLLTTSVHNLMTLTVHEVLTLYTNYADNQYQQPLFRIQAGCNLLIRHTPMPGQSPISINQTEFSHRNLYSTFTPTTKQLYFCPKVVRIVTSSSLIVSFFTIFILSLLRNVPNPIKYRG